MENDGKIITVKYVHPNYEIRKVTYVAPESIDEISEAVAKKINELLAAEKKGRWVQYNEMWGLWECSECGAVIHSESKKDRIEYHAFCGRCGARMEE